MPKNFFIRSEFAKNVATLMTGATLAQAVPIAVSPILTRLYTPEDFGILALFVSVTAIFGVIVSGKYELAILIPDEDEDAVNIAALCFVMTVVASIILMLAAIFLNDNITVMLGNDKISFWLYFVPAVVFFLGTFNILRYMSIRYKDFRNIAVSRTVVAIVSASIKLVFGFFSSGVIGLMAGTVLARFSGMMALLRVLWKKKGLMNKISSDEIRKQASRYADFPKFSLPAGLANTLSLNLNSVFITSLFSTAILGQFSLVQKIVGLPTSLIAQSVSDAYFQKATEERRKLGNAGNIFRKISKALLLISIVMFLVLFFLGEELFVFVFGAAWGPAGYYARIVALLFSIRLVVVPLSITFSVFEKQKYNLYTTLSQLMILLSIFFISWLYSLKIETFLIVYTGGMSLFYVAVYYVAYKIASEGVEVEKNT